MDDYPDYNTFIVNPDAILIGFSLILAAWAIFNIYKTKQLIAQSKSLKVFADAARLSIERSMSGIQDMLSVSTEMQKQYVKLSGLNLHYEEINHQNRILKNLIPNTADKQSIIDSLMPGDEIYHLTIVGDVDSGILDNRATIVYRVDDIVEIYDLTNTRILSTNGHFDSGLFMWLNKYRKDHEQKTT